MLPDSIAGLIYDSLSQCKYLLVVLLPFAVHNRSILIPPEVSQDFQLRFHAVNWLTEYIKRDITERPE